MALQTTPSPKRTVEEIAGEGGIVSLEIDGTYGNDRYLVKINGVPIHLTGKSFKYLTKLAWFRRMRPAGWAYKDDIEAGFNQPRYLYRMKGEIADVVRDLGPLTENNRLGYYRLLAEPEAITINVENLKSHPDFELRSLVTS